MLVVLASRVRRRRRVTVSKRVKRGFIGAAVIAALAAGGATIAGAAGGDDDGSEKPITGGALERASKAALAETGGGRVTETELGDEEGYYEVEVTRGDGSQVDVHLDRNFNVTSGAADDDRGDDQDEPDDD
jgi:uncharacterized membrane protein YkoI